MVGRKKFQNIQGEWSVRDAWKSIVPKVPVQLSQKIDTHLILQHTRLRNEDEHKEYFHMYFEDNTDLEVELELYAYRLQEPPAFLKDKSRDEFLVYSILGANL